MAAVARGFAPHQVVGLDGGRTFIDSQNLGVAVVLGHTGFFDKAHAAVHLHRHGGDFQAHLGAKALDQRHHEFVKGLVFFARLGVRVVVGYVKGRSRHAGQRAATLHISAHGHEHAAHIGVVNDGGACVDRPVHRAALHPFAGEAGGFLVGALGNRNALHAHAVACGVHHDEHVFQAAVFLAHQVAHRAALVAVLQNGGSTGLDAHLVLNAHAMHIVARAQSAVGVDQKLGHHKQADALDALRRALHAGQHQMDDVVGHVVLTPGDVNLGAKDLEGAVRLWLSPGTHHGQIAASLRLGQVHGAGPFAADQLFQVSGLEFVRACGQQRLNGTVAEQGAQRKTHVGRVLHLAAHRANGLGQALATKLHRVLQALPAAFGKKLKRLLEARGGCDHTVFPAGGVLVTGPIQRRQHAFVELGRFFENCLRRVQVRVLKTGQLGNLGDASQVLDVEQHVFDGGDIAHGGFLKKMEQE